MFVWASFFFFKYHRSKQKIPIKSLLAVTEKFYQKFSSRTSLFFFYFSVNVFLEGISNSERYQLFAMIHISSRRIAFCHGNHFFTNNIIRQETKHPPPKKNTKKTWDHAACHLPKNKVCDQLAYLFPCM